MRLLSLIGTLLLSICLTSCQTIKVGAAADTSSVEQIEQELDRALMVEPTVAAPPEEITEALLPPLSIESSLADIADERFDISVENLPARDFFIGLVKDTSYNMVLHPDVVGEISLELKNVSVPEVMDVVRDVYSFDYVQQGNLYQILPTGLRTQMFKIDYLNVRRSGSSETQVSAGQVSNIESGGSGSNNDRGREDLSDSGGVRTVLGTRIQTSSDADFWSGLAETLQLIVGNYEGSRVVVSPQSGIIVVRAFAQELRSVEEFLAAAELSLGRQVILEAKILEVQLNDGFQAGIDWNAITTIGGDKSAFFSQTGANLSPEIQVGGVFSTSLDLKDFTATIDLLEQQGTVQVLSSPRISTVNNQKAVIKVGTDEFFVTEVSSQTTTTTTSSTPTVDVELTPFFSGIALDVTPQISDEGEIVLHIHPTVSQVEDQTKTIEAPTGALTLPLALSTIRESDSVVRASNGQVIVIGGLMQNKATDTNGRTPFFADVPLLGAVFKQKRQTSSKSELVILLRAVLADSDAFKRSIAESRKSVREIRTEFKPVIYR